MDFDISKYKNQSHSSSDTSSEENEETGTHVLIQNTAEKKRS